ncbi:MAG: hypothetical protein ACR2FY_00555 [Pirellulaceae bacterium]
MELDNTRITIRERGLLDTLDLSLHVLREFVQPVFWLTLAAVIPLGILNYWLLGWMVDPQVFDYTEYRLYEWSPADWAKRIYYMLPWRYLFDMALLVFIEAPLASVFVTAYLGEAVFMQKPTFRQVLATVLRHSPALILCQLLIRGILPAWVLVGMMDHYGNNVGIEVWLWVLAVYSALFRSLRPYINEIILLEKNPLRARGENTITINKRSGHLHGSSSGELFGRWIGSSMLAFSLLIIIIVALYLGVGVLIGQYELSWTFSVFIYPAAFWVVVAFYSVVRYLDYLDLRIRYEGWEVELLMRAEATKMAGKAW